MLGDSPLQGKCDKIMALERIRPRRLLLLFQRPVYSHFYSQQLQWTNTDKVCPLFKLYIYHLKWKLFDIFTAGAAVESLFPGAMRVRVAHKQLLTSHNVHTKAHNDLHLVD